jgi:hypothetical protein
MYIYIYTHTRSFWQATFLSHRIAPAHLPSGAGPGRAGPGWTGPEFRLHRAMGDVRDVPTMLAEWSTDRLV